MALLGHQKFPGGKPLGRHLAPSSLQGSRPSDIVVHPWKKEENGDQSRLILYTINLTNPLAPKTATVRETQVRRGRGCRRPRPAGKVQPDVREFRLQVLLDMQPVACLDATISSSAGSSVQTRGVGWGDEGRGPSPRCASAACPRFLPADHVQGEPGERVLRGRRRGPDPRRALPRLLLHRQPLHTHARGPQQEPAQVRSPRLAGRVWKDTHEVLTGEHAFLLRKEEEAVGDGPAGRPFSTFPVPLRPSVLMAVLTRLLAALCVSVVQCL